MVDVGPGDVGREEVGGELDPGQPRVQVLRQALDGPGLGQAGQALDQEVPVGQEADQDPLDDVLLPDDGLAHPGLELEDGVAGGHVSPFGVARRVPVW